MDFSSAQIWFALAIVLIIAEFMSMGFFLLWPGIAALVVALLTWLIPGMSFIVQLVIFAFITIALLVPGRKYTAKWMKKSEDTGLNARGQSLVGDSVMVMSVDGTNYRVKHGDTEWTAKSEVELKKGDHAKIIKVDGIVLTVSK